MVEPPSNDSGRRVSRPARIRTGLKRVLPYGITALSAFLSFLLFYQLAIKPREVTGGDVSKSIAQAMASATPRPAFSTHVYQVIQPSLVLIQTTGQNAASKAEYGLGSGVVINTQGSILTSLHVVAGAQSIEVTFADGSKSSAKLLNAQPEKDIAVLQAREPPAKVVPAVLGNPDAMQVGDEAFVVGNPFGLYSSMSAGVISGFNRSFHAPDSPYQLSGLIQVDAAINPGNSGGPLLNRDGYVIGIVTGIVNPTQENFFVGIGFAVPITSALGGMGSPPY